MPVRSSKRCYLRGGPKYDIEKDIQTAVRFHTLDGDWNWVGDDENIFKKWLVTHWMPLPALPVEK